MTRRAGDAGGAGEAARPRPELAQLRAELARLRTELARSTAELALARGAPPDAADEALAAVHRGGAVDPVPDVLPPDDEVALAGASAVAARVRAIVERAAGTVFPVLVEGERGTGKEALSRAIHRRSPRRDAPFLVVRDAASAGAAALAAALAPDGAAAGGTVHLDALLALDAPAQAALVAHLASRRGPLAPRVVAATTDDPREAVRRGALREDLYLGLAVVRVQLAPLRDRREDVAEIARRLLARHARELGRGAPEVDPGARDALAAHAWPGNVRELDRAARALVAACPERVTRRDVDAALAGSTPAEEPTLARIERAAIAARLRAFGGRQGETARSLGIDRKTLYRKIREYGLGPGAGG